MSDEADLRILLIGMMGTGKTTVGRLLAQRHGWAFADTDAEVVLRTGRTVPELFAERGEAGFRAEETATLASVVSRPGPLVVSVAGGAVIAEANRELLRAAGTVVWLRAPASVIAKRVGDGRTRPLLAGDPAGAIARIMPAREPVYEALADVVLDVDGVAPRVLCDRIDAVVLAGTESTP